MTGLLPEHIGYENGVLGGVLSALAVIGVVGTALVIKKKED